MSGGGDEGGETRDKRVGDSGGGDAAATEVETKTETKTETETDMAGDREGGGDCSDLTGYSGGAPSCSQEESQEEL